MPHINNYCPARSALLSEALVFPPFRWFILPASLIHTLVASFVFHPARARLQAHTCTQTPGHYYNAVL